MKGAGMSLRAFAADSDRARGQLSQFQKMLIGNAIVSQLRSWANAGLENVAAQGKLAARLGTTTEALGGLQHGVRVAGGDVGVIGAALTKMNVSLGKAVSGAGAGADEMDALDEALDGAGDGLAVVTGKGGPAAATLKRLGLDAAELARGDAIDAFKKIADRIRELPTPAEKAAAAVAIFGKSGANMVGILNQGSAGIDRMTAEAKRLGVTFSDVDSAQVRAANAALGQLGETTVAISNQLAIQLAPFIKAAADEMLAFQTSGINAGEAVSSSIDAVSSTIAHAADFSHGLGLQLQDAGIGGMRVFAGLTKAVGYLGEGLARLVPGLELGLHEQLGAVADKVIADANAATIKLQEAMAEPTWGERVKKTFDEIRAKSLAAAKAMTEAGKAGGGEGFGANLVDISKKLDELQVKLKAEVQAFGLGGHEAEIFALRQKGATEAQLKPLEEMAAKLRQLDEAKKTNEKHEQDAKELYEKSRSKAKEYTDELAKIKQLLIEGKLGPQEAAAAARHALKESKLEGDRTKFTGALEAGSTEARSAILQFQGTNRSEPIKQVAELNKQQLAEARKQTTVLNQMLRARGQEAAEPVF